MAFRNIFYNNKTGTIKLWTWDTDGKRILTNSSFEPYVYIETEEETNVKSIFGTNLKKIAFKNSYERNQFLNSTPVKRIFHNLPPEQQFLLDTFKNGIHTENKLKIFYLDIETYATDGKFSSPEEAKDPINLITIFDTETEKFYTWGLHILKKPMENVEYFYCKSEKQLLESFIDFWKNDYPDYVLGWNSANYDIPFIINRITNIFDEDKAKELSPVGKIWLKVDASVNLKGQKTDRWIIYGITHLDYMDVYQTFTLGDRESYALNYIAEYELGEQKVAYNQVSLTDLADQDWQKFVEYNIQDVNLLVKLEDKLKYVKLAQNLSYKGFVQAEKALGKVSLITGAVAHQAMLDGMRIPTFTFEPEIRRFDGGYVKEPVPKIYENIVTYDANSLYPNTIITLNISPETKLGKVITKHDNGYTIQLKTGKQVFLDSQKFSALIEKEKIAISKAGVMYSQKFKGVIPKFVDNLYAQRVLAKKDSGKYKEKKSKETDPEKIKYYEQKIVDCETLSNVYKVVLNSTYGVFAQRYSPLFDIDHAESITLTGQEANKSGAKIMYEKAALEGVLENLDDIWVYGDTDSIVGCTKIKTNAGIFSIEDLFDLHLTVEKYIEYHGHEIQPVKDKNIMVPTFDSIKKEVKWGKIKNLVRHKVSKRKFRIKAGGNEIIMTEDHGCMVYRDDKLIRVCASDVLDDDKMVIMLPENVVTFEYKNFEIVEIESVEELEPFVDEYVYDIEMCDDTEHTFFANDILIHNSFFLDFTKIFENRKISLIKNGKVSQEARDVINEYGEYLNEKIQDWAKNELFSIDPRYYFKREKICDSALLHKKKHYILHVLDIEEIETDEFIYKGIDVVKSTMSKEVKSLIKNIIEKSIQTRDKKLSHRMFFDGYETFCNFSEDQIANRKRINNYEKGIDSYKDGKYGKGTPDHVKAGMNYNFLLEELKIDNKYVKIGSGNKIKYFYICKNRYGYANMGFVEMYPEEFRSVIKPDYKKQFNKLVTPIIERIYTIIGWHIPKIGEERQADLFELFG